HFYLIELLKMLQKGWKPPTRVTEEEYNDIRMNKDKYEPCLVGFVGFSSFGGKFFGGYPRGGIENRFENSSKNLIKQADKIRDVIFTCKNYYDLEIPKNSLVYCDPP